MGAVYAKIRSGYAEKIMLLTPVLSIICIDYLIKYSNLRPITKKKAAESAFEVCIEEPI